MAHRSDVELIEHVHNTARFFVEHRQIAWAGLVAVIAWGAYGFFSMPQRKDPEIPVRVAVAACQWPGATAQQVEQLVTKPIEQAIAQNKTIHPPGADNWGIRSISLPGLAFVYVQLSESTKNSREQFSDINLKLEALTGRLPPGASPVQFQSDFGDTTALMLTIASPPVGDLEIQLRARAVAGAILQVRATPGRSALPAVSIVYCFPLALSQVGVEHITEDFRRTAELAGILDRPRTVVGRGFIGVDGGSRHNDQGIGEFLSQFINSRIQPGEIDPDVWYPVIVRDPAETAART